jgi:hypothetical protein
MLFIAPIAITIAIILFYFLFILRLKPSEKALYESSNKKIPKQKEMKTVSPAEKKIKPLRNYLEKSGNNLTVEKSGQPPTLRKEIPKKYLEKSGNNLTVEKSGQPPTLRKETNKFEETVVPEPSEDQKEPIKTKDDLKAFFLYGKVDFKGCTFKYGYLKTMPKYKPIPHECFGCPHILECVGTDTEKSKRKSSNKERLRSYYGY